MNSVRIIFNYFIIYTLFQNSAEEKFVRTIEAVGLPYYKISLKLGICQENILFLEHKVWPVARMNRIMDIYYKSEVSETTVSSVEIKLVLNDTDCVGFSESGVGLSEFSATIFLANNMAVIFYNLAIYTCSPNFTNKSFKEDLISPLPFYTKFRQPQHDQLNSSLINHT